MTNDIHMTYHIYWYGLNLHGRVIVSNMKTDIIIITVGSILGVGANFVGSKG